MYSIGGKPAHTGGHSSCLFCLGEAHHTDSCSQCLKFWGQTRKIQVARLHTALMEAALPGETVLSTSGQLVPATISAPKPSAPTATLISTKPTENIASMSGLMPGHIPLSKSLTSPTKKKSKKKKPESKSSGPSSHGPKGTSPCNPHPTTSSASNSLLDLTEMKHIPPIMHSPIHQVDPPALS